SLVLNNICFRLINEEPRLIISATITGQFSLLSAEPHERRIKMATVTVTPVAPERERDTTSKPRAQLTEVIRWSGFELAIRRHWPPLNIYPKKVNSSR